MKFPKDPWKIVEVGYKPSQLAENESVFSLANGYIGFRGNFEEGVMPWHSGAHETFPTALSIKGTYLNGVYETAPITYGESAYGYAKKSQTICNVADTKGFIIEVDGEVLQVSTAAEHMRELDMQAGVLRRRFTYTAQSGAVLLIETQRLVSQVNKHRAAMRVSLTCQRGVCEYRILSGIDTSGKATVVSDDPRTATGKDTRLIEVGNGCFDAKTFDTIAFDSMVDFQAQQVGLWASQRTKNSDMAIGVAVAYSMESSSIDGDFFVFAGAVNVGQAVVLDKFAAYYSGEAKHIDSYVASAKEEAMRAAAEGFDLAVTKQKEFYNNFWDAVGMDIVGDDATLQGLRFNMFHLLQSAGRDGQTNIAAKGLTGEGYEGHYFWDTEIYVFPFMLHVSPAIAKELLMYRYSILDHARNRAREMGHDIGALFPWRTIGGEECSAYYPAGTAQYHINGDIAYAISSYVSFTEDYEFLFDYGAEILVETARLWYNLGFFDPEKNAFCINCVTGPDEYNTLVNNNVYTNMMAKQNMLAAMDALGLLKTSDPAKYKSLITRLDLAESEGLNWKKACDNMHIPYNADTKIYPQDDGFMHRKPWPIDEIPAGNFPLLLHYHPLVIYRHMVCKQADLVLAMLLLGDKFTPEEKKLNFHYYDKITTHDSSLSKAVFSIIACEIGEYEKAYDYFMATARLDLDNTHKNTKDGLHMANMAGTWLGLVQGFAGMRCYDGVLSFAPCLPQRWDMYTFKVHFKGRVLQVSVDKEGSKVSRVAGEPLAITIDGVSVDC